MPISLRLSAEIKSEIAGFSARQGVSKSAVIVCTIQEFLARNAQPTSFQVYQEVMAEAGNLSKQKLIAKNDAKREAAELRPLKFRRVRLFLKSVLCVQPTQVIPLLHHSRRRSDDSTDVRLAKLTKYTHNLKME